MKTFKSLLCIAACSLGMIGGVNAATIKVSDETVKAGTMHNEAKIKISDDDLSNFKKVEFQLSVSNTFYAQITNVQASTGAGLSYEIHTENDITTYTFKGDLSEKELATITFRTSDSMDSNINITPVNVKFYKDDNNYQSPGDAGIKAIAGVIKYERPKSSEASLTSLVPSQGTLSPEFDSTHTNYTVQVKDTIAYIRFTAEACQGATVTGNGSTQLEMGENTIEIEVTAEDGQTKNTYTIKVIRGEVVEPSAYIKDLVLNNIGATLSPKFDSKNNKYTVQIGKEIEKLDFKYELEDPLAEVTIEGNENFVEGENLVKIKVVSSNKEDEQIYEITVIKSEEEQKEPITEDKNDDSKDEKKINVWLIVGIVTVVLAVVAGVTIILFKKKKNDKKKIDNTKLPLKRREGSEKTVEIDTVVEKPKHAAPQEEEESITDILKTELYDDDRTQKFNDDELEKLKKKIYDDEEIDQTKEFNFKDFE